MTRVPKVGDYVCLSGAHNWRKPFDTFQPVTKIADGFVYVGGSSYYLDRTRADGTGLSSHSDEGNA